MFGVAFCLLFCTKCGHIRGESDKIECNMQHNYLSVQVHPAFRYFRPVLRHLGQLPDLPQRFNPDEKSQHEYIQWRHSLSFLFSAQPPPKPNTNILNKFLIPYCQHFHPQVYNFRPYNIHCRNHSLSFNDLLPGLFHGLRPYSMLINLWRLHFIYFAV